MFKSIIFVTLSLIVCLNYTQSFPSGAPATTCANMKPSHEGAEFLTSELSPFDILVTSNGNSSLNGLI